MNPDLEFLRDLLVGCSLPLLVLTGIVAVVLHNLLVAILLTIAALVACGLLFAWLFLLVRLGLIQ